MTETNIERVGKLFAIDTADHEMTILLDEGLHRHVRFMRPRPGSSSYWYELITVPHALIFRGDYGSLVFSRVEDMFGFFRSNPDRLTMRISPDYWAEKLTSDRDCVKVYSRERLEERLAEEFEREEKQFPGIAKAWAVYVEDNFYDLDYEEPAREALRDFEFPVAGQPAVCFEDAWEWDLKDFDHGYLWACHAVVAGIARYDAAKAQAARPVETVAVTSGAVA
jgi:hypothetical protein